MSAKWIRGKSTLQTYQLDSSYVIHKGDIMMFDDGQVQRATTSMGLIDQAFAGIYEGPELTTSTRGASDTIQIRVPNGPFVIEVDCSGTFSTATIGNQYGIATSEISSGTSAMIGVANVDYGNFIHIGGTNSSGRNLFMGLAGTISCTT